MSRNTREKTHLSLLNACRRISVCLISKEWIWETYPILKKNYLEFVVKHLIMPTRVEAEYNKNKLSLP